MPRREDRSSRINPVALTYLWAQIAADIRADISSGKLQPGDKLPAEVDLAQRYGVARMTVRRAIADLAENGEVVVLHGRGTFVAGR